MKIHLEKVGIIVCVLAIMLGGAVPIQGQGGSIIDRIVGLASEYEIDPTLIRAPTSDELRQFWLLLNRTLESDSLEDLAWLRPYAGMALTYLDSVPEARPFAEWLRQRMDYLWVAEEIMQEERAAAPPPPPKKPDTIAPPPRQPAPPSATRVKQKSMDMDRWVKRMESRPAPAGAAVYVPRLKPVFQREGVPSQLVWLAEVESSFNPNARSPVGALGLYQFMPATAERFGLSLSPDDERLAPERSAAAAAKYLKFLHGRFGSWPLALAAYNAGEGRVGRLLNTHKAGTFEEIAEFLPAETRMYVPKVGAVLRVREGVELNRL
ncbi:MAG TPA: lytic transglycosylase domain-containing protein [Kiritimatiellia bacterium]|nr:lytic transglycosylase domain-containing protein [Kiritimatiellia bacterium]